MSFRSPALTGYRRLLRATKQVFSEDKYALIQSRIQLRQAFEASKNETNMEKIKQAIADIDEAEDFLRNNIVQARRTERGTYAMTLKPPHGNSHLQVDALDHDNPVPQPNNKNDDDCCKIDIVKSQ
jgi:complex III assembly factor LYRM7